MTINEKVIESVVYRRVAPFLLILSFVIAIAAAVGTYVNDRAIDRANTDRIEANEANLVIGCQNGNESRRAARTLWNYAIDLVASGDADLTAAESAYFDQVRNYIDTVYMPRDCTDLSRKYDLPDPPPLPPSN